LNRHKITKVTIGKGRKSRIINKKSIIKPTKPSRLATVWALERSSVSELAESSWNKIEIEKRAFDKKAPLTRDYNSFIDKMKVLVKEQWDVKQIVLNASKFRQGALSFEKGTPVSKKILEMRKASSLIEVVSERLVEEFKQFYITLFSKLSIKDAKGFTIASLTDFTQCTSLKKAYPITYNLCIEFAKKESSILEKKELDEEESTKE